MEIAIADCGDGSDDEVNTRDVLIVGRLVLIVVAIDPSLFLIFGEISDDEPQTAESVHHDQKEK